MNKTTTQAAMNRARRRGVDLASITPSPLLTPQRRKQISATTIVRAAMKTVRSAQSATR